MSEKQFALNIEDTFEGAMLYGGISGAKFGAQEGASIGKNQRIGLDKIIRVK